MKIPYALAIMSLATLANAASAAPIFVDDFSSNTGWTLGPKWQIGPTSVSPPSGHNQDPAFDHTPSADNGVLGTVLGGNIGAPDGLHGFYYATSPVINLMSATDVSLSFFRWLNSDYDPFMTSQVEVYDGSLWQVIYTNCCMSSAGYVSESAWSHWIYDVSSYADGNASFQVRFSYDVTSTGVYTIGGWNVDDLQIAGTVPVPEPNSLLLLGLGLVALAGIRRRKNV